MPQNGVYDLLKMLEIALDEGYSVLKYTVVNRREIETLIDRIYAALPVEVQEAKLFLKRKDERQKEAEQQAQKIVQDARSEADRMLSESDQIKAIEREGIRIKNEVVEDCEKVKHIALQDAENIRLQATEDAIKIFKLKEDSNDPNEFINCIWYTVCGDRYTLGEINLIKSLVQKVTKRDIPIIVIYTKASNSDQTEEMINNIQNSLQDPNIQVIP